MRNDMVISTVINSRFSFPHVVVTVPPANVSIRTKGTMKENDTITLTCESSWSNPPATVTWWRDGVSIPAPTENSTETKYSGKKVRTMLELKLTPEFDGAVYTCQALNPVVKKSVHDAVTLQVKCKRESSCNKSSLGCLLREKLLRCQYVCACIIQFN